jgi:Phage integrase family
MTLPVPPMASSLAEAIAIIDAAVELPDQARRHWATSLRRIAKALDRPLETLPASYSAVWPMLAQLHPVSAGMTTKTLQNHRSNVKSALLWLRRAEGMPKRGQPLALPWQELRDKLDPGIPRSTFSLLMRFCSARSITPTAVDEAVIDRYIAYRSQVGKAADAAYRRGLARAWNSNVGKVEGWPAHLLIVPPAREVGKPAWEEFPDGLQREVEHYLETLKRVRRTASGRRARPQRPNSIRQRRAELEAAARTAVKAGVPIEALNSLSALLAPDVVEKILDAYWGQAEIPKTYAIDLASKLLGIARETKCLDEAACERLDGMRHSLEAHRRGGMTDKNTALIRQVLTPGVWGRVVNLPMEMMAAARSDRLRAPLKAAVTAQLAVAIAILTVAPVRRANLTTIKLGFNLIKPDGPDSDYWLVFPDYDVKNRVKLEFPLEKYLTRLIDEYVYDFRPNLMRGSNGDFLFPGQCKGAKQMGKFSTQIMRRIFKATGLQMKTHQFRHAAGAIILRHRPGEYELVRRVLGHRNIKTTIQSYVGLETVQANEIFSSIVLELMDSKLEAAG